MPYSKFASGPSVRSACVLARHLAPEKIHDFPKHLSDALDVRLYLYSPYFKLHRTVFTYFSGVVVNKIGMGTHAVSVFNKHERVGVKLTVIVGS